ncbi:O-antigen biosynthesis protein RfbC [Bienertia sinuspersici]
MAQFPLTPYFTLMVILLFTPMNHFNPISLASSQAQATNETQRLENICTKTLESYECFLCIKADTSRDTNDTPDLIHSLLHCMYSETNLAHINADLLSQNSSIPSLKAVLSQCSSLLFDASNSAVDAMTKMESNQYARAWDCAKTARRSVIRCAKVFLSNGNVTAPAPVVGPMVHAKRLYDSMHVLFQLIVCQN